MPTMTMRPSTRIGGRYWRELPQKGVGLVVNPGCTLTSSEKAVALAAEFPHVYAAVGLHPENCHDFQPEQIERLRQLAQREKVMAIGEVGLDYYWEENPPPCLAAGGAAAAAGAGGGTEAAGDFP